MPALSRAMNDKLEIFERDVQDRLLLLETAVLSLPQRYKDHESRQFGPLTPASRMSSSSLHEKNMSKDLKYGIQKHAALGLVSPALECLCPSVEKRGHRTGCHLSFASKIRKERQGSLKIFNYLIHYKIVITYSRQSRLINAEICPNFTLRAICSEKSPAFQLLCRSLQKIERPHAHGIVKPEQIEKELSACLLSLRKLFAGGKASPVDVLASGTSLLHVRCIPRLHI